MRKFYILCACSLFSLSYGQIALDEQFEGTAVPKDWTYVGKTGWLTNGISPLKGNKSMRKSLSATASTPNPIAEFTTNALLNSNGNSVKITISTRAHRFSDAAINATVTFFYTIDGGETWIDLGNPVTYTEANDPNANTEQPIVHSTFELERGKVPENADFRLKVKTTAGLLNETIPNNFYMYFDNLTIFQSSQDLPQCTTITGPMANSQNVPVDTPIQWEAVGGADSYLVYIGTNSGDYNIVTGEKVTNATHYKLKENLQGDTVHYIKVVPLNEAEEAINCTESSFKTTTPPVNDEIHGATVLNITDGMFCEGGTKGTFKQASQSVDEFNCDTSANPNNDVWYSFIAQAKRHIVQVTPDENGTNDLYMTLYHGSPYAIIQKECIDEETAILDNLEIGEIYFIRLFTRGSSATDSGFSICLSTAGDVPANDTKETAFFIDQFDFNQIFDTSGYTNRTNMSLEDVVTTCSDGAVINLEGVNLTSTTYADDGIWASFKGTGKQFAIRSIASGPWDARIDVYRTLTETEKQKYPQFADQLTCVATKSSPVTNQTHTIGIDQSIHDVMYYINISNFISATKMPTGKVNLLVNTEKLGIEDPGKKTIAIYPNPVSSVVHIDAPSPIKRISIFNVSGARLLESTAKQVNLEALPKGTYLIQVILTDGSSFQQKLIKK